MDGLAYQLIGAEQHAQREGRPVGIQHENAGLVSPERIADSPEQFAYQVAELDVCQRYIGDAQDVLDNLRLATRVFFTAELEWCGQALSERVRPSEPAGWCSTARITCA
jgi:hypothetical protein